MIKICLCKGLLDLEKNISVIFVCALFVLIIVYILVYNHVYFFLLFLLLAFLCAFDFGNGKKIPENTALDLMSGLT